MRASPSFRRPPASLFFRTPLRGSLRSQLGFAVAILALSTLLAPIAAGQVFLDVEDRAVTLTPGETSTTNVTITNPANRSYSVQVSPAGNLTDHVAFEPKRFNLERQGTRTVEVAISPPMETTFKEGAMTARFTFVDRETGEPNQQRVDVSMVLERDRLYLGLFEDPLPTGYDTDMWLFGLEVLTWSLMSIAFAGVMGTAVHMIVPRASEEVQEIMAGKMRAPFFFLPLILGLDHSWRLLPELPVVDATGSLLDALSIVIIAIVGYRVMSAALVQYGENVAGETETEVDDVLVPVLEKLSAAIIVAVAGFYAFKALGVDFSFLVAGGLVAGLVISMAAQDTLSNLFAGVHILIDQPFREGDVIQLESGEVCRVERVGLRSTNLYHFQRHQEIIAPNNELATKRIVNMTYPDRHYRVSVPVGVAYGTDLEKASKVLHNIAMDTEEVLKGRTAQPRVFIKEFGESAIQLELRAFVPDERDRNAAVTKLVKAIHERFEEEGIEIPFPQRVVKVKGAEVSAPIPRSEETA